MKRVLSIFLLLCFTLTALFAGGTVETEEPTIDLMEAAVRAGVEAGLEKAAETAPAVNGREIRKPEFFARNGMVVCESPVASMIGTEVLRQGGNAYDAAVAVAAVLTVDLPQMCGIGGHGIATIYDAEKGELRCLDFGGQLPAEFEVEQWGSPPVKPEFSVLASILPGTPKGWETLLETYGTMELAELLEPAIFYAENGISYNENLIHFMHFFDAELFAMYPELAKFMLKDGEIPEPGDVMRRPDLAETYRLLSEKGIDEFYKGDLAEKVVTFLNENGSRFTLEEFASYEPRWRDVISTTYHDTYEVFVPKAQVSSPAILTQLNIWENFDLPYLGHYSTDYLHLMLETSRMAFADRRTYYGDPAFNDIPYEKLVSKEYGKQLADRIDFKKAEDGIVPGDVSLVEEPSPGRGHTTHLVVVDKWGNMVSLTQTLGFLWGSWNVVPGTGITMNNEGIYFDLVPEDGPNYPIAGKLSQHDMSPTIVFKDGKPYMVIGTPGGEAITQIIPQVISNIIDFGMAPQDAVDVPRVGHIEGFWVQFEGISQESERTLRRRGFDLDGWSIRGNVNCIVIDPETGTLRGGSDYDGMAIGY